MVTQGFLPPSVTRRLSLLLAAGFLSSACGYSQEEWDQKVRELEAAQNQLAAQRTAHKKCEQDHSDAVAEVDQLKKQLRERGVNLDNLSTSLQENMRALEEYKRRAEQLDQIRQRFENLRTRLKKLTDLGLKVEVRNNRMLIQLPGDVLFDSGKDSLKPEGITILEQVADVVKNDPDLAKRYFQVAGHTDSAPLKGGFFRDNWGLSAMRARSVLVFLTGDAPKGGGLEAKRWSAAGYADTDPVAPNDSDEGRAKNRRVELVVVPDVEEMLNLQSVAN
ncbi:MAG: OmpA family protein [Polyangiaceae bacterium]|nr:OmpA family protein [Polyangiaceae bacterium]MCW5789997.1 OmpA family protein [Polyangiaceae bacterium]